MNSWTAFQRTISGGLQSSRRWMWLAVILFTLHGACCFAASTEASVAKTTNSTNAKLPQWIHPDPFHYASKDKPDPFRPFIQPQKAQPAPRQKKKPKRPLTPLEKVQPTQLSLVGILNSETSDRSLALVELPNGKGYILHVGTRIGRNNGNVTHITSQSVTIEEEVRTILGEKRANEVVLKLPKASGENIGSLRLSQVL